ncbi:GATA zinc finger domain containing 2B [Nesidiocoris tenuis]|uniref:GATA zinc finger domain containing 2B n=1 Tax=Nesidiocoris tenuis TaxID=355587 RepID=A0ABN7ADW7_9HEMI|nr:GATA zinc finger domain containing 2B [Nesidiocoris tenuis]
MEKMEVEEAVVDLSLSNQRRHGESRLPPPPLDNRTVASERLDRFPAAEARPNVLEPRSSNTNIGWPQRRSLRPRAENRSYVESPDVIIVDEEPKTNGYSNGIESDEDLPMPPLPLSKNLSEADRIMAQDKVRKLRDQLRNEEMTLVLLKKLRQSYQIKENVAVVAPCSTATSLTTPPKPVTPRTTTKQHLLSTPNVHHLLRTPVVSQRASPAAHPPPPPLTIPNRNLSTTVQPQILPAPSSNVNRTTLPTTTMNRNMTAINFPSDRKDQRHSPAPTMNQINQQQQQPHQQQLPGNMDKVGINIPVPPVSDQERIRVDDSQTPAQRQAAAKLALRKQLEKTLLQIPPPKPPPPEMHFIPNPSNTEFIYLVGLEHVVDFITKDSRSPPPPEPFRCSQCSTNFTPVWKWEKGSIKGKEPRVICEQCVTTNVKKALKAEHTNRLKTAFVKALQQEQEIEQRLAQGTSPQPEVPSPAPAPAPQPPPPPPPPPVIKPPTPKPAPPGIPSPNRDHLSKLADTAKFNPHHAAAAIHQQFLRASLPPHQPLPAHMLPFNPLLYPYQLAMAQAAGGKGPVAAAAANIAQLENVITFMRNPPICLASFTG